MAVGSYPVPMNVSAQANATDLFDADRYNLGKDIVARRVQLSDGPTHDGDMVVQATILGNCADKLPTWAQEKYDLLGLAGRLSADRLEAVTYFLQTRFKLEDPTPSPPPLEAPTIQLSPQLMPLPPLSPALTPSSGGKLEVKP
jgi:hypothetical protein